MNNRPDLKAVEKAFQPRMWFPHGFDTDEGRIMWVYRPTDHGKFAVGFFCPDGTWVGDAVYDNKDDAAARVNWLNGGAGRT